MSLCPVLISVLVLFTVLLLTRAEGPPVPRINFYTPVGFEISIPKDGNNITTVSFFGQRVKGNSGDSEIVPGQILHSDWSGMGDADELLVVDFYTVFQRGDRLNYTLSIMGGQGRIVAKVIGEERVKSEFLSLHLCS